MFSSRQFILFFFVVTSLLAMGSARGLFFWARQNDQQDGPIISIGAGPTDSGITTGDGSGTTSEPITTTDDSTTTTPTTSDTPTTTSTTPTTTSTTPTSTISTTPSETTSTIPNTTPGASTQVVVIQTSVVSGSTVPVTTTRPAGASATNDLASADNSGSSGGMTTQTRNVAIGVGVGVGGAILLGGLAVVAWRMWGRKKQRAEEDHFLMSDPISEKPSSPSTAASPFKSTLDQYHNPAGRLNTAANF